MEFQKGMDLSFIPELEDAGVQVKDFDGTCLLYTSDAADEL